MAFEIAELKRCNENQASVINELHDENRALRRIVTDLRATVRSLSALVAAQPDDAPVDVLVLQRRLEDMTNDRDEWQRLAANLQERLNESDRAPADKPPIPGEVMNAAHRVIRCLDALKHWTTDGDKVAVDVLRDFFG